MNSIRRRAFHEAAHAVAAYLLKIPLKTVSIATEGESGGQVTILDLEGWLMKSQKNMSCLCRKIEKILILALAGNAGEILYKNPDKPFVWKNPNINCLFDLTPFKVIIDIFPSLDKDSFEPIFYKIKEMFLKKKNQKAVARLAEVLIKNKIIKGNVAKKIIKGEVS